MIHFILLGILLGFGVAIPIGPMNLEMMRRNLRFGTRYGVAFGCGVSSADLLYLILLATGSLGLLQYPPILTTIGIVGSLILIGFGISTLRMQPINTTVTVEQPIRRSLGINYFHGLLMTFVNPFTVIFWASVNSQIIVVTEQHVPAIVLTGCGVLIGTMSWIIIFNTLLHITKHKLSNRVIHYMNNSGGIIIILFGLFGLTKILYYDLF